MKHKLKQRAVFDEPDSDESGKIAIHPFGLGGATYHSWQTWQKQERFKGRWMQSAFGGIAGTSEMGWGFSTQGYYGNGTPPLYQTVYDPTNPTNFVVVRIPPYGTNDAHAASSGQLRIDPVFNHTPPEILSGNLSQGDIDILLARGVPALSGPLGSSFLEVLPSNRERDLNNSANPLYCPLWPRRNDADWTGWCHSDIKDVALPFIFQIFLDFGFGGDQ